MRARLLGAILLGVLWVALWEDPDPVTWVAGAAIGLAVLSLFPSGRHQGDHRLRPLAVLRLLGYFAWKLMEASAIVAWEVVTPRNRIHEGIVAVPIRGVSDVLTTLVANAITLTPGTLTLEVDQDPRTVLYVHVLHLRDVDSVRREIDELEQLVVRAFGSRGAQELLEDVPGSEALRPSQAAGGSAREGGR